MTIALAVSASDGLIMATDTEESADGFWKVEQGKMRLGHNADVATRYERAYAVAAAGSAGLCDALMEKIVDVLAAAPPVQPSAASITAVKREIETVATEFHNRHILPLAVSGHPANVRAIVAAQFNGRSQIWTTELGTIADSGVFAAIGIGDAHARVVLDQLWRSNVKDVYDAIFLGAYAVHQAKEFVAGCGKFTNIAFMRRGDFTRVPQEITNGLDVLFARLSREAEPPLLKYAFHTADSITAGTRVLQQIRAEFAKARKRLRSLE